MPSITTTKQEAVRRQTGVKLDTALLREFKILAAKRESTLDALLEDAMKDYLEGAKGKGGINL